MNDATFTAFQGDRKLASGPLSVAAGAAREAMARGGDAPVLVFDDATGRVVDLDPRGPTAAEAPLTPEVRGRGRPRLGVVAREVTLLPRHWDWLAAQPGGASVALRKLVEEARRSSGDRDRNRQAKAAAYAFMSAMAGNRAGFEEACRALFADDRRAFSAHVASWPADLRDHAVALAFSDQAASNPA